MFKSRSRRRLLGIVLAAGAMALLVAGAAGSTRVIAGNLIVDFNLGSAPKKLPAHEDAPVRIWGSSNIHTKDGSTPTQMEHLRFEFDKFGHLETRGLETCTRQKLLATTAPKARKLCPGAIIGTGSGSAEVAFPEQAPIPSASPITFFNGPKMSGDPSVLVHAHLKVPVPTTYIVPVRIERINRGIYGFRVESDIPAIAGGYGSVTNFRFTIDRKWRYKGKEFSYANARCPIGHLQARLETQFRDGTKLNTVFIDPCQAR